MDTRRPALAALLLATMLALTACGGGEQPAHETRTAPNGDTINDADVAFATDMIPHHAQALTMVDLTHGRRLHPDVARLAERIRAAQAPEIEQMTGWLTAWGEPVPGTMHDHANGHGADHGGATMDDMPAGMMGAKQMSELEHAPKAQFHDMWLAMMIEHHQGAIQMARTEQDEGVFKPAVRLAEKIESAQRREIEQMRNLLERS